MKPRPSPIALGDQLAAHPRQHAQNLELEIAADGAADRRLDVVGGVVALLGAADDGKAPLVAAVDGDDGRPGAFRPDEDVAVGLALVVQRQQVRAAEDHVGGVGQHRIALHRDAERLAHQAARAVAADDVARQNLLARAGLGILDHRRDQIGVLRERRRAACGSAARHCSAKPRRRAKSDRTCFAGSARAAAGFPSAAAPGRCRESARVRARSR